MSKFVDIYTFSLVMCKSIDLILTQKSCFHYTILTSSTWFSSPLLKFISSSPVFIMIVP